MLESKHPKVVIPPVEELEEYAEVPAMMELDITVDTVTQVAAKLSGAGGPGGLTQ